MTFTIPGIPIGKPRMTQRDKGKRRPCVGGGGAYMNRERAL